MTAVNPSGPSICRPAESAEDKSSITPHSLDAALPDDVLEQAVGVAQRSVPADVIAPSALLRPLIEAVAPALIEHGRQQERERIRGQVEGLVQVVTDYYHGGEGERVGQTLDALGEIMDSLAAPVSDGQGEPDSKLGALIDAAIRLEQGLPECDDGDPASARSAFRRAVRRYLDDTGTVKDCSDREGADHE